MIAIDGITIAACINHFPKPNEVGCVVITVKEPVDKTKVECAITYTNRRPTDEEIYKAWSEAGQPLAHNLNYAIVRMRLWPDGWFSREQRPDNWRPEEKQNA